MICAYLLPDLGHEINRNGTLRQTEAAARLPVALAGALRLDAHLAYSRQNWSEWQPMQTSAAPLHCRVVLPMLRAIKRSLLLRFAQEAIACRLLTIIRCDHVTP